MIGLSPPRREQRAATWGAAIAIAFGSDRGGGSALRGQRASERLLERRRREEKGALAVQQSVDRVYIGGGMCGGECSSAAAGLR